MFDYANLDRPIVMHADDWEAYEAARGTYFDLRAFPPGAVARSEDELIDIFATGPLARLPLGPAAGGVPRALLPVRRRPRRRAGRAPRGLPGRDRACRRSCRSAERRPVPSAAAASSRAPRSPPCRSPGVPARHRQPLNAVPTPGSPHALEPVAADPVPAALLPPDRAAGRRAPRNRRAGRTARRVTAPRHHPARPPSTERAECPASASSSRPMGSRAGCPRRWTRSSPSPSATSS